MSIGADIDKKKKKRRLQPMQTPTETSCDGGRKARRVDPVVGRQTASSSRKDDTSPEDFVKAAVRANGFSPEVRSTISMTDFFEEPTDEQIAAYDQEVIQAICDRDLKKLRAMHSSGRTLQCCNRFGESLIHMACRRGFTEVVVFLVQEAEVSLRVRDDYGRSPLHDACWAPEPNFDLVDFLIKKAPELLLLSDVRGHTPFAYVRRNHWNGWLKFLSDRKSLLRTKAAES